MLHVQRCLPFYSDFKGWKSLAIACSRLWPAFTIMKLGEKAAYSIQTYAMLTWNWHARLGCLEGRAQGIIVLLVNGGL